MTSFFTDSIQYSKKVYVDHGELKEEAPSAEKARKIRRRVINMLPSDLTSNYKYYVWTWIHHIVYTFAFIFGYYYQMQFWNDDKLAIAYLIMSPIFAWGFVGIFVSGHDAVHDMFAPKKVWWGKVLNKVTEVLCLDCLGASHVHAHTVHEFHHNYTNGKGDYEMVAIDYGLGLLGEIIHPIRIVSGWLIDDLVRVLNVWDHKRILMQYRIILALALIFRISVVLCSGYPIMHINGAKQLTDYECNIANIFVNGDEYSFNIIFRPDIAISNILWLSAIIGYIFFIPHMNSIRCKEKNDAIDIYVWNLKNTYEAYSGWGWYQNLQMLLHCGITMHATHHVFPFIPRSLMHIASTEMIKEYPNECRTINSISEEIVLWWNRKVFNWPSQLYYLKEE